VSETELVELLKAALAPSFVLIRRLGAGGMGIVYLARDPALKRLVAVKVLSPERAVDEYARARFAREAESVAAISHPNVVAVHSVGELANGIPYLVMQYVDGQSMADRLSAEGPLDLDTAKQIIGQVASALAAAHRKGIIHRDIKAANILWDDTSGRALVSDFGIAAVVERRFDSESIRLTQTGMMMGTPEYMSPEQFLGEEVTDKVDIYSLGLLGYELLTGEGPYQVSSPRQLPAAHLRDAPRVLSSLRPDADPELETLLANCLEKIPNARPSAEDVSRRLARGASVLLEWPPPGLESLHGAARHPVSLFLAGGFGVAVPLMIAATAGENSMLRFPWPQVVIWPLLSLIGATVSIFAVRRLEKLLKTAVAAARAGYGWGTIAEVLVDERRDTGALITGEREYVALAPAERDWFRRSRVIREALRLGAGLWCVAGLFIGIPLAVRALTSPNMLIALTLGIPALLLGASAYLEGREASAVAGVRGRLGVARKHLDRLTNLAATWRQSFDQVTAGLRPGQGFVGRVRRMKVAVSVLGVAVVLGGFTTVAMMLLPVFDQTFSQVFSYNETSATDQYRDALRMQPYRVAVDPSITPLRAGEALHSISLAGDEHVAAEYKAITGAVPYTFANGTHPSPAKQFERPAAVRVGTIHKLREIWGPFHENWTDAGAIKQVRLGLSPVQRRFLVEAARQPGLDEFEIVARAPAADYIAATLVQPLPAGFVARMIPGVNFDAFRSLAYSRIAQAALDFADGRPALAERRLREVVGAGFTVMESRRLDDSRMGMQMVRTARDNLVALYEATGRSAEASAMSISPLKQSFYSYRGESPEMRMTPVARSAYLQSIIRDGAAPPGLRWLTVTTRLTFGPCGDLRQMLFGPDPSYSAHLAEARRLLVRLPGDELIMRLSEDALKQPVVVLPGDLLGAPGAPVRGLLRGLDAISGSHRFSACLLNPGQF
jgi:hypothetical protein